MNVWKKIAGLAPGLSAVLVAVCAGTSLSGYQMPVYEVEQVQAAEAKPEEKVKSAEEKKEEEPEEEEAAGSFDLEDGTYEGEGTGFSGKIRVSVTVKDKKITAVDILETQDDAAFFNRAKAVIDQVLKKQKLDVDVVSGATYSSRGILSAIKNALTGEKDSGEPVGANAGKGAGSTSISAVEDPAAYKDGTYYGTGTGFSGAIKVKVDVKDGAIASIQITETSDGSSYIQRASGLIQTIIAKQSTNVDTVSGATYSSVGIIEAVRNALRQAAASENGANASDTAQKNNKGGAEVPAGRFPYKEGIYYGTGEGYKGEIQVGIVIQDQTLKNIVVLKTVDDENFFGRARQLLSTMLEQQTTQVDTVSGATFSSEGLIEAVQQALEEAKKAAGGSEVPENPTPDPSAEPSGPSENDTEPTEPSEPEQPADPGASEEPVDPTAGKIYENGVYTVTVPCLPDDGEDFDPYQMTMQITLQGDRIVGISGVTGDGDPGNNAYINRAANGTRNAAGVVTRVLEKGSPEGVDAVSRATCSSDAILEACRRALDTARIEG